MTAEGEQPGEDGATGSSFSTLPPTGPSKTPAFQAIHAARYQRQELIRTIEAGTRRQLICYVGGLKTLISRDDVVFLVDLLHNVEPNKDVDLLLHTPGGDMDAAEKLITMVRNVVGTAMLRVVVPDFAKSAGTLMALGADYIVMSDSSELGPIDPQIALNDGNGNRVVTPIQSYLEAYREQVEMLDKNPGNVAAQIMLQKFDPARLKLFETALERARVFAETQLKYGMFRAPKMGNFTEIASELMNANKWQSHGQMIGHADAAQLGLSIEYLNSRSKLWQGYWQLYCHQRLEIQDKHKLFESNYASLSLDAEM